MWLWEQRLIDRAHAGKSHANDRKRTVAWIERLLTKLRKEVREYEQLVQHGTFQAVILRLIDLSIYMEEIVGQMVQVDQDVLDGFATQLETVATVLANEINTLLQAAAAAGVPLPQASVDNLTKAIGDLTALETPTAATPPVTDPPVTTPPVDTPPATTPPADGSGTTPTDGGSTPPVDGGSTPVDTTPVDTTPPADTTPPVDTTPVDTGTQPTAAPPVGSTDPTVTPPSDGADTSGTPPA